MLENDLYTLLSTNSSVLAAMGGNNNIFLGMIPKGSTATPALVMQAVFTNTFTAADGPTSLAMRRIQFDVYATKYTAGIALAGAVRKLSFAGSYATVNIQGAIIRQEMDLQMEPGTSGYVFRRMLEIDFWYVR